MSFKLSTGFQKYNFLKNKIINTLGVVQELGAAPGVLQTEADRGTLYIIYE